MTIALYLAHLQEKEEQVAAAFLALAQRHADEAGIRDVSRQLASWSLGHVDVLEGLRQQYGKAQLNEPDPLRRVLFKRTAEGGIALLRDLQDMSLLVGSTRTLWTIVLQAAVEKKDKLLSDTCASMGDQTDRQQAWLCTQIKHTAPQVLLVPANLKDAVADKRKSAKKVNYGSVRRRVPANAGR